jgi:hypothetical protein
MGNFKWNADSVSNFQVWSLPARSVASAANLYVRITGIANFPGDPGWDDDDPSGWKTGSLLVNTPVVLQPTDLLIEHCITAGFRRLDRDEEGSTDDFGMALDEVPGIEVAGSGNLTLTISVGYKGDVWTPGVSFAADLLVYREALDGQPVSPPPPSRLDLLLAALVSDHVTLSDFLAHGG